jgi:hypothetical protein
MKLDLTFTVSQISRLLSYFLLTANVAMPGWLILCMIAFLPCLENKLIECIMKNNISTADFDAST